MDNQTASQKNILNNPEWILLTSIILIGLFLRWYGLDVRPLHHDESMHAMFGRYFQDHPEINYHKYNPMMHGPILYHTLRYVYDLFGVSTWLARSPVAFLGSLFIFLPFLFRKYFSKNALIALTTIIAFSPVLIYWSRFIIHDYFVIAAMLMVLYGVVLADTKTKSIFVILGITLQWCIKANLFVTLAILAGYLLFEAFVNLLFRKEDSYLLKDIGIHIKNHKLLILFSLFLSVVIFCYFYSSEFRYSKGILDGLYREVFPYWLNQHETERIKGPFAYNFFFLSWYEFPFIITFFLHYLLFYWQSSKIVKIANGILLLAIVAVTALFIGKQPSDYWFWSFFKLKSSFDIFWCLFLASHAVLLTIEHSIKNQRVLAFWGYFFLASFWSYSYLGEKVPWLATYPFIAGLSYYALYFDKFFSEKSFSISQVPIYKVLKYIGVTTLVFAVIFIVESSSSDNLFSYLTLTKADNNLRIVFWSIIILFMSFLLQVAKSDATVDLKILLFVVFSLYTLRITYLTNFHFAGHANEFISQVHTTPEFDQIMKEIRKDVTDPLNSEEVKVLVTDDAIWPATWYMEGAKNYFFQSKKRERSTFKYIIQKHSTPPENVPEGFSVKKVNLRGWWVPDYSKMTIKNFLSYVFFHEPWSDKGYSYADLLQKSPPEQLFTPIN